VARVARLPPARVPRLRSGWQCARSSHVHWTWSRSTKRSPAWPGCAPKKTPGVFCREPYLPDVFFAFTNYGVSVGLQSVVAMDDRVARLNDYPAELIW